MSRAITCTDCTSISNFPNIGFGTDFLGLKKYYDKVISDLRKAETLGRLDEAFQYEPPERHANITEWPDDRSKQKLIALELASKASLYLK